ncbi:hypothetical protein FRC12_019357 [Ceratobasidium sp. 428]|nr:hypothetical protein FRC12_019357 [Ceratobasidium sp. 428]
MTIPTKSESNLLFIARRTLGWPDTDKRPIPPKYLKALSQYVAKHPNHTNFIIDLEDHGGVATCMDCLRDVRVGRSTRLGLYEFQDLQLLEVLLFN